jgi:hypothetical protein
MFARIIIFWTTLRAGRSGNRIPVRGARFSPLIQTSPGAHPTFCAVDTRCLSRGLSGRGVAFTIHLHLVPRLKEEYSYTSTPPWDLTALGRATFTFVILWIVHVRTTYASLTDGSEFSHRWHGPQGYNSIWCEAIDRMRPRCLLESRPFTRVCLWTMLLWVLCCSRS